MSSTLPLNCWLRPLLGPPSSIGVGEDKYVCSDARPQNRAILQVLQHPPSHWCAHFVSQANSTQCTLACRHTHTHPVVRSATKPGPSSGLSCKSSSTHALSPTATMNRAACTTATQWNTIEVYRLLQERLTGVERMLLLGFRNRYRLEASHQPWDAWWWWWWWCCCCCRFEGGWEVCQDAVAPAAEGVR